MEYYAKDCEIVIGLVSPVGVNLEDVKNRLVSIFEQFNYTTNFIHLSEIAANKEVNGAQPTSKTELSRLNESMTMGTKLRTQHCRGDYYALLAIEAISAARCS